MLQKYKEIALHMSINAVCCMQGHSGSSSSGNPATRAACRFRISSGPGLIEQNIVDQPYLAGINRHT